MISSIAWLPAAAVKPILRERPLTEEEIAEARRLAAEGGSYPPVGAGAELYDEDDDSDSSEWETDDGENDGGMDDAAAVSKAKAAAKRIKADVAGSAASGGKGKVRASRPVGTGGLSGLDAAMAELDMDNYDDDDGDEGEGATAAASGSKNVLSLPAGVFSAGTQYYASNRDDPYLKFGRGPKESSKVKGKGVAKNNRNDDDSDFATSSDDETDDDDDLDDWQLRPGSDLLLLAARNEDDVSHLEVWVCEPPGTATTSEDGEVVTSTEANVYVHHDLLLAAFPLCLAWLDASPGSLVGGRNGGSSGNSGGSFAAVGTMEPGIEIWDVNVADAVEPCAVLGPAPFAAEARAAAAAAEEAARMEAEEYSDGDGKGLRSGGGGNNKKKSKKRDKKGGKGPVAPATPTPRAPAALAVKRRSRKDAVAGGGHADAVLGLSWNGAFRNVLASASADRTVKVWDLASSDAGSPVATFAHHVGKVQSVAFNPADPPILLTGGFDGRAALVDVRCSSSSPPSSIPSWSVGADVEALAWDPSRPTDFYVASEDGVVSCFDARKGGGGSVAGGKGGGDQSRFRISAHSKAATALAFAGAGAGSGGVLGASPSSSSSPSSSVVGPGLLATGSTDKKVKLWDVSSAGTGGGGGGGPELVSTADLKVGAVFGLGFGGLDFSGGGGGGRGRRPLLAAAGAKGTVAVWDVASDENVARRWRKTLG